MRPASNLAVLASISLLAGCGCSPSPPAAPSPPAPGKQIIDEVRECLTARPRSLELALTERANLHKLTMRVLHTSPTEFDAELLPARDMDVLVATDLATFEPECLLFNERYRNDEAKKAALRTYLKQVDLDARKVTSAGMLPLGFLPDDVQHLTEHLARFLVTAPSTQTDNPYRGIRYIRVTYTNAPAAEVTTNVGTDAEGYQLTRPQQEVVTDLREVALRAAQCPE